MMGATLIMAMYSVWSRTFIQRSSRLGFLAAGEPLTLNLAAGVVAMACGIWIASTA